MSERLEAARREVVGSTPAELAAFLKIRDRQMGSSHPRSQNQDRRVSRQANIMIDRRRLIGLAAASDARPARRSRAPHLRRASTHGWPGRSCASSVRCARRRHRRRNPPRRRPALRHLAPAGRGGEPHRRQQQYRRRNGRPLRARRLHDLRNAAEPGGGEPAVSVAEPTIRSPISLRSRSSAPIPTHGGAELLACAFGEEFIAYAKANRGKITYASAGTWHLARTSPASCSSA